MGAGAGLSELVVALDHLERHRQEAGDPHELTALLYASWYARPSRPVDVPSGFPGRLAQVLRSADVRARCWSGGWLVEHVLADGRVIVRRAGTVAMVARSDYVDPRRPGLLPRQGDELMLAERRDRVDDDGDWWRTACASWRFTGGHTDLLRLYWAVEVGTLAVFVERLTTVLATEHRPWMLKCAAGIEHHARADATVLYVRRDVAADHAGALVALADELAASMHPVVPPFTLAVRPGLGLAVDPDGMRSFGEHRCAAIVDAAAGSMALTDVAARLAAGGLSMDRPHALQDDPPTVWDR